MESLQISGKTYISCRQAAKDYGYHSDYIGQLIRGGKIKGQKVGRAWYVESVSLSDYLGSEKKSSDFSNVNSNPSDAADVAEDSEIQISASSNPVYSEGGRTSLHVDIVEEENKTNSTEEKILAQDKKEIIETTLKTQDITPAISKNDEKLQLMTYLPDEEPMLHVQKSITKTESIKDADDEVPVTIRKYEIVHPPSQENRVRNQVAVLHTKAPQRQPRSRQDIVTILNFGFAGVLACLITVLISLFIPTSISISL